MPYICHMGKLKPSILWKREDERDQGTKIVVLTVLGCFGWGNCTVRKGCFYLGRCKAIWGFFRNGISESPVVGFGKNSTQCFLKRQGPWSSCLPYADTTYLYRFLYRIWLRLCQHQAAKVHFFLKKRLITYGLKTFCRFHQWKATGWLFSEMKNKLKIDGFKNFSHFYISTKVLNRLFSWKINN